MKLEEILKVINLYYGTNLVVAVSEKVESGFTTMHIVKYEIFNKGSLLHTIQEASLTKDPTAIDRLNKEFLLYVLEYVGSN